MPSSERVIFRVLAGILAIGAGVLGTWAVVQTLTDAVPWYRWLGTAFGQLVFAWAFGAYALGFQGPFNWRTNAPPGKQARRYRAMPWCAIV